MNVKAVRLAVIVLGLSASGGTLQAQTSAEWGLSLNTSLLDSRLAQPFLPRSELGLDLELRSAQLYGAAEVEGLLTRSFGEEDTLEWELKRGEAQFVSESWLVGGGRMALRHRGLGLHEAASDWLGSSPKGDGLRVSSLFPESGVRAELVFLAPEGAGASVSWCSAPMCPWVLLSWQGKSVSQVPVAASVADVRPAARQSETWFLELALSVKGEGMRAVGAFQGSQSGPFYPVRDGQPGPRDETLPDSRAAYRAVAQFDVQMTSFEEGGLWVSLAAGGGSAPRLYWGRDEADFLRQGGGGRLFVAPAFIAEDAGLGLETGLLWVHAKDPVYLWFGERENSGQRRLSKELFGFWSSLSAKF